MKAVANQLRALRRRFTELVCRFQNFRYWRARGMPFRTAWRKADLTL